MKTGRRKRRGKTSRNPRGNGRPASIPVGVVGLGLMGTSIATCLLAAGHPVVGVETDAARLRTARRRSLALLREMRAERALKADPVRLAERFTASGDYGALKDCGLVVESIFENVESKKQVIRKVEEVVSPEAVLGSNTSAIPVSLLQEGALHPERIFGIHWAEPAHTTRFMEIICGDRSDPKYAQRVKALAENWGKEPSVIRRDIRGFITNRCMYALLREAFHLVESGYATIEDVDRSVRNDFGYWITFAGPFRYMDLTGIPAYEAVMRDLLPDLSNETGVPSLISNLVKSGARGVSNAKGFYRYTPATAKRWEELFMKFSYEIRALGLKYPQHVGDHAGAARRS